jgi:hypothetical protein
VCLAGCGTQEYVDSVALLLDDILRRKDAAGNVMGRVVSKAQAFPTNANGSSVDAKKFSQLGLDAAGE